MKKLIFLSALLLPIPALAQTAITLPIAANAVADLGNGPIKARMIAGNASIFTSQGSGLGSTSGSSTTLTLTTTPATPPAVGGLISGAGITSGTTVTAYNGTTGVTLSAAMTVAGGTAVSWGAACPSSVGSAPVIQASPSADGYVMYTQARVCAVSPGGPVNTLLISPVFVEVGPTIALDQICATDNNFLVRLTGNWGCGSFGSGLTLTGTVLSAIQQSPGVINVKSSPYNAACDGSTDDTTAIQAAVVAAGGANTGSNVVKFKLFIPGKCVVSSTITIRNVMAGVVVPFVMECSGGDAGLVWGGTDNTGPLLTFGDATSSVLDSGFLIEHCLIGGKTSSHKPSVSVLFANNQNAEITNSGIVNTYVGVKCTTQCLFAHVDRTYFACTGNCIQPAIDNGAQYSENNFIVCGAWCFFGANEATSLLINNYFEGNVAGASGSVHVAGDGIRLISNTFEDQSTAAGSGFLSIELNNVLGAYLAGNYYVGGCGGGAGCPNYFIALTGSANQVEFHGETTASGVGASGKIINATTGQPNQWYGGMQCTASQIWGGSQSAFGQLIAACGTANYLGGNGTAFGVSGVGALTGSNFISKDLGVSRNTYSGTCAAIYNSGGSSGGTFEITPSSCSAQTVIVTFAAAAPNGWACQASDLTTPADTVKQTAAAPSTATFLVTAAATDIVSFQCTGY